MRHLRIGTRGSLLAKWQAEFVRKQLFATAGVEAEIVIIKTSGDKLQTSSLSQIGGKGIFIKELEEALLEETIDLAVHSIKDVPTDTPSRLMFPAVCRREDVRDCLVAANGSTLASLRQERELELEAFDGRRNFGTSGLIWTCAICGGMWTRVCERWKAGSMKR